MKLTRFILPLLVLLAAPAAAQVEWQRMDTTHFAIYFPENEGPGAMIFAKRAEKTQNHVAEELGYELLEKTNVYLAPDRETYNVLQPRGHVPEWSIGTAIPRHNKIVMFSPRGSYREKVRAESAQVFAHELTHITVNKMLPLRNIPRWLDEGLAQLVAHEWQTRDTLLLTIAVLADNLIPLHELRDSWPLKAKKARLAYLESLSLILYLRETRRLTPLLHSLRRGKSLRAALLETTGTDMSGLETRWLKQLKRQHSWPLLLMNRGFLWFVTALILIVGYLLVRRRRRRQYELLDDDLPYYQTKRKKRIKPTNWRH